MAQNILTQKHSLIQERNCERKFDKTKFNFTTRAELSQD